MKTQEYLNEIRKSSGLKNAILTKIVVDERRRSAEFNLITDRTYSPSDEAAAVDTTEKFLPEGTKVSVKISKLVADADLIAKKIYAVVRKKFPAAGSFVTPQDIRVEKTEGGANFYIEIGVQEQGLFRSENILDTIAAELSKNFCGSFIGNVCAVEREEQPFAPDPYLPPAETQMPIRVFPVVDYKEIDGGEVPKYATYIADVQGENQNLVLCGEIRDVREKQTSAGKLFYVFTLSDKTSEMRVTYFTKKRTIDKAKRLQVGDRIVCRGDYSAFRENLSYTARYVNYGSYPEDFVPAEKPTRGVPAAYKAVFPEPFVDYNQAGFFDNTDVPDSLKRQTFVVYDIETTGLNNTGLGGRMDAIIELGAVKVKEGVVVEKFSSFVAADRKLSQEIIDLTGISDEMLVGAPDVSDVIADFYKFCDGCALVGHNSVGFDSKFINYYGKQNDFVFKNPLYDTLFMAQQRLHLNNYKLNTIADHYGVAFNHHRAFDDALATAKIFIALAKEGCPIE